MCVLRSVILYGLSGELFLQLFYVFKLNFRLFILMHFYIQYNCMVYALYSWADPEGGGGPGVPFLWDI